MVDLDTLRAVSPAAGHEQVIEDMENMCIGGVLSPLLYSALPASVKRASEGTGTRRKKQLKAAVVRGDINLTF